MTPAEALGRWPDLVPRPRLAAVLAAGPVKDSWLVESAAGPRVLRIDRPLARTLGLDRAGELRAQQAAAAAGLAVAPLASDPERGLLLTPYLPGRALGPADLGDRGQLRRLGALLRQVHAVPWTGPALDLPGIIRRYADAAGPAASGTAREALGCLEQARGEGEALCFCHNDPVAGNIIETGGPGNGLRLIDWEYAAGNDPWFDLAVVAGHHQLPPPLQAELLEAAGGAGADLARLARWTRFYGQLAKLWLLVVSPDG